MVGEYCFSIPNCGTNHSTQLWLVPQLGIEKQESLLPCHAQCNPAQNTPTDDHYRPAGDEEGGDNALFKLKIKTKRKTRKKKTERIEKHNDG